MPSHFIKVSVHKIAALVQHADAALSGNSNDAEHDALYSIRMNLANLLEKKRVMAYTENEQHLALELFRDKRGLRADPDLEPDFWHACLVYARELLDWDDDDYDLDQYERTGAPYPED